MVDVSTMITEGEESGWTARVSWGLVESAAAPGAGCPSATSGSSATRCRGNSGGGGGRRTTVAYVINEASQGQLVVAESEALQCLREACETVGAALETLHFGKLDFGETAVLDRFYNAGACDLTMQGPSLRGQGFLHQNAMDQGGFPLRPSISKALHRPQVFPFSPLPAKRGEIGFNSEPALAWVALTRIYCKRLTQRAENMGSLSLNSPFLQQHLS